MTRLQLYSRWVGLICRLFLLLVPIGVIYFWLTVQTPYDYPGLIQYGLEIESLTSYPLSMQIRLLAIVVSLVYALIIIYALNCLIKLFNNYQKGEIFTLENAGFYKKLGYSIFCWTVGGMIYHAIMTGVISFNNPPGERIIALSITGVDILSLLIGLLVVIISWVMQEGYRIADENTHTI